MILPLLFDLRLVERREEGTNLNTIIGPLPPLIQSYLTSNISASLSPQERGRIILQRFDGLCRNALGEPNTHQSQADANLRKSFLKNHLGDDYLTTLRQIRERLVGMVPQMARSESPFESRDQRTVAETQRTTPEHTPDLSRTVPEPVMTGTVHFTNLERIANFVGLQLPQDVDAAQVRTFLTTRLRRMEQDLRGFPMHRNHNPDAVRLRTSLHNRSDLAVERVEQAQRELRALNPDAVAEIETRLSPTQITVPRNELDRNQRQSSIVSVLGMEGQEPSVIIRELEPMQTALRARTIKIGAQNVPLETALHEHPERFDRNLMRLIQQQGGVVRAREFIDSSLESLRSS